MKTKQLLGLAVIECVVRVSVLVTLVHVIMVRTIDLCCEYHSCLSTVFNTCFLSNEFEEEFLDRELQKELTNTPSITKPRTTRPTITDWIYDAHQTIPNASSSRSLSFKGLFSRMKFYKIKESHDEHQINLTPVTENQKYWIYNKSENKYCCDSNSDIDDLDSIIWCHSLVLPQSSISKEPIFRIEVSMKICGLNPHKTRIDIKLSVECSVRAWGVSSFVEKFLINSVQNTYNNWLEFATQKLMDVEHEKKQKHVQNALETVAIDVLQAEDINMDEDEKMDVIMDAQAIEIHQCDIPIQQLTTNMPMLSRENVVQKRNVNKDGECSIHVDGGSNIGNHIQMERRSSDDLNKVHESRGLSKRGVPLRVRVCRCGTRICPSIFLRKNKKTHIDLVVDSRCKYVEKSLWCVIVVCCIMIIILTLHRYQSE
eukprot:363461_1